MAFGTNRLAFLRLTEVAVATLEWKPWPDLTTLFKALEPRNPEKLLSGDDCKAHIILTVLFVLPDPLSRSCLSPAIEEEKIVD